VDQLAIPLRVINALKNHRLRRVRDIATAGISGLMKIKGIGPLALARLAMSLRDAIERYADSSGSELEAASSSASVPPSVTVSVPSSLGVEPSEALSAQLTTSLALLDQYDVEVLRRRMGYYGPPENLEAIGARLGVTRERARQRESRALRKIKESARWPSAASARIAKLLFPGRTEPLHVDLLAIEDRWFDGFDDQMLFIGRLLEACCGESVHLWSLKGRLILARIDEDQWDGLVSSAFLALENAGPMTEQEVKLYLESMASKAGAAELSAELFFALEGRLHFGRQGAGDDVMVSVGRGQKDVLAAILKDAQGPLSLREVIKRYKTRTGRRIDKNRCSGALRSLGAYLVARGTFVWPEYLTVGSAEGKRVVAAVEKIIQEGAPGRQWHCVELLSEMNRQAEPVPAAINPYILNVLLSRSERLRSLKRLVWVSRSVKTRRREIEDLCVAVLRKAGRPMTTAELRAGIETVRGLNSGFQPQANAVMTRVAEGVWGLVERDIPLSQREREMVLETLAKILRRRRRPVHLAELPGALAAAGCGLRKDVKPEIIAGLALTDPRFHSMRGDYWALAEG
jgi:hypothetical protein